LKIQALIEGKKPQNSNTTGIYVKADFENQKLYTINPLAFRGGE